MDLETAFKNIAIACVSAIAAFFDSTLAYLFALLIGFSINIVAGFRADEVKIQLRRVFPPLRVLNFSGNKLKDSLAELLLITSLTYLLKLLIDLMDYSEYSRFVVQFLIAVAIYYYFRNSLRNLKTVYPKNQWLKMLYAIVGFRFKEIIGEEYAKIVDENEKKD